MQKVFIGFAVLLFAIAFIFDLVVRDPQTPPRPWSSWAVELGLVFFAASFWPGLS